MTKAPSKLRAPNIPGYCSLYVIKEAAMLIHHTPAERNIPADNPVNHQQDREPVSPLVTGLYPDLKK
jgi:hypothetical protein